MAEGEGYVSTRIAERVDLLNRELAEIATQVTDIDPGADVNTQISAALSGIGRTLESQRLVTTALLDLIGTLGAEIDRLRHQLEHPAS